MTEKPQIINIGRADSLAPPKLNVSTKIKKTDKTKSAKRENFCLTSFFKKAERTAIEKSSLFVSILNH